ncbi:hypothetical protein V8F20_000778 [Naviculisporaceae sp. PSN 640]
MELRDYILRKYPYRHAEYNNLQKKLSDYIVIFYSFEINRLSPYTDDPNHDFPRGADRWAQIMIMRAKPWFNKLTDAVAHAAEQLTAKDRLSEFTPEWKPEFKFILQCYMADYCRDILAHKPVFFEAGNFRDCITQDGELTRLGVQLPGWRTEELITQELWFPVKHALEEIRRYFTSMLEEKLLVHQAGGWLETFTDVWVDWWLHQIIKEFLETLYPTPWGREWNFDD